MYMPVIALTVFAVLVAIYVGLVPRGALLHWGESSVLLGFTGVAAGANLMINSALQAWAFYGKGVAPFPYRTVFNGIDRLFLHGTLIFGVLGGAALLTLGLLWMFGGKPGSTGGQWLSLLPIAWAFCRLARYVQSYSSTLRHAFFTAQAATLILSLMFFYMVGQHLNGRLKLAGVSLPLCAFAFGMISVSAFAVRWYAQAKEPALLGDAVIVIDATDLLNGLFALAVGAIACSKKSAVKTKEYKESLLQKGQLQALQESKSTDLTEIEARLMGEMNIPPLGTEETVAEEPDAEVAGEIAEEPPVATVVAEEFGEEVVETADDVE